MITCGQYWARTEAWGSWEPQAPFWSYGHPQLLAAFLVPHKQWMSGCDGEFQLSCIIASSSLCNEPPHQQLHVATIHWNCSSSWWGENEKFLDLCFDFRYVYGESNLLCARKNSNEYTVVMMIMPGNMPYIMTNCDHWYDIWIALSVKNIIPVITPALSMTVDHEIPLSALKYVVWN